MCCVLIFCVDLGCAGSSLLCGSPLVVAGRAALSLRCVGSSLRWVLLLWSTGFTACSLQYLQPSGSVAVGTGPVAPRRVESSQTRDGMRVPCIGRWILYHWTTRGAPSYVLL